MDVENWEAKLATMGMTVHSLDHHGLALGNQGYLCKGGKCYPNNINYTILENRENAGPFSQVNSQRVLI